MFEIHNKYNVGDKVYLMEYLNGKHQICCVKVDDVLYGHGKVFYNLLVPDKDRPINRAEEDLFSNEEQVKDVLKKRALEKYEKLVAEIDGLSLFTI